MPKNIIKTESHDYTTYQFIGSKWTVNISHSRDHNSYFELDHETIECSGILELAGNKVVGYDGVFELPKPVCRLLHSLKYTFDEFILPDGIVL